MTLVSIIRPDPLARAKLVVAVIAAIVGVSIAFSLSPRSSSHAGVANDVAAETRDASITVSRTATTRIVPAPAIDPGAEVFIGTGDGGNGFWARANR